MTYKVIWLDYAERQLDSIFEFLRCNSKNDIKAYEVIAEIYNTPDILVSNPRLGQKEFMLRNRKLEYRYLISSNYKIIYSIDDDNREIRVTDVFDTRQNPTNLFRNK